MRRLPTLLASLLLLAASPLAQDIPDGWTLASIGGADPVSAEDDDGRFFVTGGSELGGTSDQLAFLYKPAPVDSVLIASGRTGAFPLPGGGGSASAVGGLMMRASLAPDAPFVFVGRASDGTRPVYYRFNIGGPVQLLTVLAGFERDYSIFRRDGEVVIGSGFIVRTLQISLGQTPVAGVVAAGVRGYADFPRVRLGNPEQIPTLPAGWFASVRPSTGTAVGSLDASGLDVDLAAGPTAPPSGPARVAAFQLGAEVVEGTIVSAAADGDGAGLVLLAEGEGLDSIRRTYVALLRRPDGAYVLRHQDRYTTSPDIVLPAREGAGTAQRWRLRIGSRGVTADQSTGSGWIPRGYAPTLLGQGVAAGAISIGGTGRIEDVVTRAELPNDGVAPLAPVYVGYGPLTFDPDTYAFGARDETQWTVRGPGDIWGTSDQFFGLAQQAEDGRGVAIEGVIYADAAGYTWSKGGFMVRESLDPAAAYAFLLVRPNGEHVLQTRVAQGGQTSSSPVDAVQGVPVELVWNPGADRVEVLQSGQVLTALDIDLGDEAYGLLVSTSTDIEGRGDAMQTRFEDTYVRFPSPTTQACAAPPDAFGAPTAVGGEVNGPVAGRACWLADRGVLQVRGGGDVWGQNDQFEFVQQTVGTSDVVLSAERILPNLDAPNAWDKNGLMLRSSLDDDAPFVFLLVRSGGGLYVQMRPTRGAPAESFDVSPDGQTDAVRLEATGSTVRAFADGAEVFSTTFARSEDDRAGFAVTSTDADGTGLLTTGDFYAPAVQIDGATQTAWESAYVLAVPDPLETGSAEALSAQDGQDRFAVTAAGDIWGSDDQFQFVHQTLSGDGVMTVEIESFEAVAPWAEPWAKAGPMVRQIVDGSPTSPQPPHKSLFTTLGRGIHFMSRVAEGGATDIYDSPADGETPGGPLGLRIERVGERLFYSVRFPGTDAFSPEGESVFQAAAGPAAIGFALASTQPDFQSPGQVRATVGLRLTQTAGTTAAGWTETFDGMPRATSDGGATAWWGGQDAALTDDGALAIGDAGTWRSEPVAAAAGLDARLTVDTDGAADGDRLRVLALVGDAEVEIATVSGQSGTQTVEASGLRGSAVELRLVAQAPGGAFRVTEAALSPALPPVADEAGAEAPVSALALSAPAPNPTRGDAWIDLAARDAGTHRLDVIDLLGRRVATLQTYARAGERVRVALPLGGLGAGVYVVRATAPDGAQAAQRLTVVR